MKKIRKRKKIRQNFFYWSKNMRQTKKTVNQYVDQILKNDRIFLPKIFKQSLQNQGRGKKSIKTDESFVVLEILGQ